ncbi:hypothetical protein ADN00_16275 [Ornatilinea apprima]|uniref:Flavodoxin domain-containing protein n=1 Tax=Ornatilinea apprima TaxID=1134406 RepID=A0A0P6WSR3_9CHLR|nr:flavodoxin domain-containing protein [Ornatilinea apprima]KPL72041.1 hypothetical protein ADN00_16275 [Ornatilinea apprima]
MKENKILVTYATMSGSSQEIAEFVLTELQQQSYAAEIQPCRMVKNLNAFSAVVLGTPLYMFHLHKDALRFLSRHQKALRAMPVALFAGGLYVSNTEEDRQEVQRQMTAELAKFPWLTPSSLLLVGGRFDPDLLRFPYNLIPALKQSEPSDLRDWNAIRDWAHSLPSLFATQTESPVAHARREA